MGVWCYWFGCVVHFIQEINMWIKKNNSVVFASDHLVKFLDALANKLPFDIVVTSGDRSPREQAIVVKNKIDLGDDITKVYVNQEYAKAMIQAYPDLDKMTQVTIDYAPTPHIRGDGIDIRTRDLSASQIQTVYTVAKDLGAQAIIEKTPPHIHLTVKKNGYKMDDTTKKTIFPLLFRIGAVWIIRRLFL